MASRFRQIPYTGYRTYVHPHCITAGECYIGPPDVVRHPWGAGIMWDSTSPRDNRGRFISKNDLDAIKMVEAPSYVLHDDSICTYTFLPYLRSSYDSIIDDCIKRAHIRLAFQQNNSFELIPFLMDYDKTLATVAQSVFGGIRSLAAHLRKAKALTSGDVVADMKDSQLALQYGLLPILSDLKSLRGTLSDLNNGIEKALEKLSRRDYVHRCPVRFKTTVWDTWRPYTCEVEGHVVLHGNFSLSGVLPKSELDHLAILADELGIHPDLKTIWDIIPFSFVLDYFLPIGDLLESLHPRGWFTPHFSVSGYSVKVFVVPTNEGNESSVKAGHMGKYRLYRRRPYESIVVGSRAPVIPEWEAPDMRELLLTGLLALPTTRFD